MNNKKRLFLIVSIISGLLLLFIMGFLSATLIVRQRLSMAPPIRRWLFMPLRELLLSQHRTTMYRRYFKQFIKTIPL